MMDALAESHDQPGSVFRGRAAGRAGLSLALAGVWAVAVVSLWPALRSPRSRVIGSPGDMNIFSWGLQYAAYWPTHGCHPLFTRLFFPYSGGSNLAANTFVPLIGIVFAPVTLIFGVQVAYNAAMFASVAVLGSMVLVAVRRVYGVPPILGLVLACSAMFGSAQLAGLLGHLHLAFLPVVFGLLLLGWKVALAPGGPRQLVLLAWLCLAQALISSEMLLIVAVTVLLSWPLADGERFRQHVGAVVDRVRKLSAFGVLALVTPVAAIFYFLLFATQGPEAFAGAHQPPGVFVTDLASLVIPTSLSGLRSFRDAALPFTGNGSEWYAFLGLPVAGALFLGRRVLLSSPRSRAALTTVVVSTTLSFGPSLHIWGKDTHIPMPWAFVQSLPVFSSVVPARFSIVAMFGVIGCVAELVSHFWLKPKAIAPLCGVLIASIAMGIPNPPLLTSPLNDARLRSIATDVVRECPPAIGSVGVVGTDAHLLGLGIQARARFRFLLENGFSFRSEGPVGVLDLATAAARKDGPIARCILSLDGPLDFGADADRWSGSNTNGAVLYRRSSDT